MKAQHATALWNGVRMRRVRAGADPDCGMRMITMPADWGQDAAAALAALAPGEGAVSLAQVSADWIARIAGAELAPLLTSLLLHRAAAPSAALWQGRRGAAEAAGFVLNLAAFAQPGAGFDVASYVAALGAARETLRRFGARDSCVRIGNFDACLAMLGLDYDSADARDVGACLAALTTATLHPGARSPRGRNAMPPERCKVPALAEQARAAWHRAGADDDRVPELFAETGEIESGFSAPGPVDALLGFEACGIAPIFSPVTADGKLAASTLARLSARAITPQAALAATLSGETVLPVVDFAAIEAMHRAVSPFIDRPSALLRPPAPPAADAVAAMRRELPARHGGFTQKASVGGHRLYLRTGNYPDGSLGEVAISSVRESAAQRGLMDAFGQAVSLGLQHGVPLAAYVEAFAYTRFGPHGAVEGDAAVGSASSLLDYAFRTLAQAYLGRTLADAPQPAETDSDDALLPLDLPLSSGAGKPGTRRQHGLRLVG